MNTTHQQLREHLKLIEKELRALSFWESSPPGNHMLSSSEPFCLDTLILSQWLQWILIPRMHALLDGNLPLPKSCSIHPYAEENFKGVSGNHSNLLSLIKQLDQALSADNFSQN